MFTRDEILSRLREQLNQGNPILACSAGLGLCAHAEELGGADLIFVDTGGYHRMQGRPSNYADQPIMDYAEYVINAANDILSIIEHTPVIVGIMGNDTMHVRHALLDQLKYLGYSGIINSPSMVNMVLQNKGLAQSLSDPTEATVPNGWSYRNEVKLVEQAHEREMLAVGNVYTEWHAEEMAKAGADIIVADMGITIGGRNGGREEFARTLDEAVEYIQSIVNVVRSVSDKPIICCHGGPLCGAKQVDYIYKNVNGVQGFFAASAVERIPIEREIADNIRSFTETRIKNYREV